MDFIRMVIEGGWVVRDNEEWIQVLKFLEIDQEIKQSKQVLDFFTHVSKVYGFEHDFQEFITLFI